jgi:mannose-6-phosphate isomerase-like protein (cupin superfamily)
MKTRLLLFVFISIVGLASYKLVDFTSTEGYIFERDREVGKKGASPHNGKGSSTGYSFFENAPNYPFAFRKRVLHKGATIGYHKQAEDEVYYIISGTGLMTINGEKMVVKAGDAILTRTGSSHGLAQRGEDDLTLIITYKK